MLDASVAGVAGVVGGAGAGVGRAVGTLWEVTNADADVNVDGDAMPMLSIRC